MILTDTCVIIDYFREDTDTIKAINAAGIENIVLNSIIVMEVIAGARNKIELNSIKKRLNKFRILDIDQVVMDDANQLLETFHLSNGLKIPDAIIAATARVHSVPLFSYNEKDFSYIENVKLFET